MEQGWGFTGFLRLDVRMKLVVNRKYNAHVWYPRWLGVESLYYLSQVRNKSGESPKARADSL